MGVNYKAIPFAADKIDSFEFGTQKLVNIQVFFPAKGKNKTNETLIFTAHHDIANPNSENCQDNTASVCNLLDLCSRLKRTKNRNKNVYVVFTDSEEFGGRGASRLCYQIHKEEIKNVIGIVSLELTACGSEIWVEGKNRNDSSLTDGFMKLNEQAKMVRTPYNESVTMRRLGADAICIGILPKGDMEMVE